jgi:hypothetical protein
MKHLNLVLSGIIGAGILWINVNLGSLFYIALLLAILDVVLALFLNEQKIIAKLLKQDGALALPFIVKYLANSSHLSNVLPTLHIIFAVVIVTQLEGLYPYAETLVKKFAGLFPKSEQAMIEKILNNLSQDEIRQLLAKVQNTTAGKTVTTAMNQGDVANE